MKTSQLTTQALIDSLPPRASRSVVEWARRNVKLVGSARSERYDPDITPWTKEPLECAGRIGETTFVKPIQSGGSVVGEIAVCYWLANWNGGDIQYNWQNDDAADARFGKRVERILKASPAVMRRMSGLETDKTKWKKGLIHFPHCNFIMQGVFSDRNVASDSIRGQVNEELHDEEGGWFPGRLEQARGRTTAFWNKCILNISNAGVSGGQLHQAYLSGTQQRWEVKCPGCGEFHFMRTRWDEDAPQLGGLRYDGEASKREDGGYNYDKIAASLFFQMPCGYKVHDDVRERRGLSLSGRYSAGENPGAASKSFTLDAVAVDYIPWVELVQKKHLALRALRLGDPKPWFDYLRERECQFASPDERPIVQRITLSERKKDRAGLPDKAARFAALDRQQGTAAEGELPHWWVLVQDFDAQGNSLIVFEGKCLTDEDAVDAVKRHEVAPRCVVVDSGDDTTHVYQFCLRHGYNAIKGSGEALFSHADGARRIFSAEKPLHLMLGQPETSADPLDEPQFWFYSKSGIRERLMWLRSGSVKYEVPSDVSEDFKSHFDAERLETRNHPRTGQNVTEWVQVKKRNDLFVCACYCAMLAEMAGLIGANDENK